MKILAQILSIIIVLIVSLIDYYWNDKRTKNYRKARYLLFLVIIGFLFISIFSTLKEDQERKSFEEKNVKHLTQIMEESKNLQKRLLPFEEMAKQKFPNVAIDLALEKLKEEIDLLNSRTDEIEKKAARRTVNFENKFEIIKLLGSFRTSRVTITNIMGDSEGQLFGAEIQTCFQDSGWIVNGGNQAVFSKPILGLVIEMKNPPPNDISNAVIKAINLSGHKPYIQINPNLSDNEIAIIVGGKET